MEINKVRDYYVIEDQTGEYYFRNLSTDKKHPQWKLFWYISPNKDNQFEVNGIINVDGNYVSVIINQGKYKRHFEVNTSNRSEVGYDIIEFRSIDDKLFPEKNYISIPIYNNLNIKIQDYFRVPHNFVAYNGEVYNGILSSNQLIVDFMKANKKLGSMLDEMTKRKKRKK